MVSATIVAKRYERLEEGRRDGGRRPWARRSDRESVNETLFDEAAGMTHYPYVVEVRSPHLDQGEELYPYSAKETFLGFRLELVVGDPKGRTEIENVLATM